MGKKTWWERNEKWALPLIIVAAIGFISSRVMEVDPVFPLVLVLAAMIYVVVEVLMVKELKGEPFLLFLGVNAVLVAVSVLVGLMLSVVVMGLWMIPTTLGMINLQTVLWTLGISAVVGVKYFIYKKWVER